MGITPRRTRMKNKLIGLIVELNEIIKSAQQTRDKLLKIIGDSDGKNKRDSR